MRRWLVSVLAVALIVGGVVGFCIGSRASQPTAASMRPPPPAEAASPGEAAGHASTSDSAIVESTPLARKLAWVRASAEQMRKLRKDHPDKEADPSETRQFMRELAELHQLALADPEGYLRALRCVEDEESAWLLVMALHHVDREGRGLSIKVGISADDYPEPLVTGLLELLKSGPAPAKAPLLEFLGDLRDLPEPDAFAQIARDQLANGDPRTQAAAIRALWPGGKLVDAQEEAALRRIADQTSDPDLLVPSLGALVRVPTAEAEEYVLSRLSTTADPHLIAAVTQHARVNHDRAGGARFAQLLCLGVDASKSDGDLRRLAHVALEFEPPLAVSVIDRARARATDPRFREILEQLGREISTGNARIERLQKLLHQ